MKVFESLSKKLKGEVLKSNIKWRTIIIAILFCIFTLLYLELSATSVFYATIWGAYIVFSSFILERYSFNSLATFKGII